MGVFDDISPEQLKALLADRRKLRGRVTGIDASIPAGSPEYQKKWREINQLRSRLYQKRNYLKRRKIVLATQKYEAHTSEELVAALKEIDDQIASIREVKALSVDVDPPLATPVEVAHEPQEQKVEIPFVREMADKHNISYDQAHAIMFADDYRGEASFEEHSAKRLEEIIGKPLTELE